MNIPKDRIRRSNRLSLLSTGLALLIAFVLLMVQQYVVGRASMLEAVHTEAAMVSAHSAAALMFNDAKAAQETINTLGLSPRVVGGALYRADGVLLASIADEAGRFPSRLDRDAVADVAARLSVPKTSIYGLSGGFLREDVQVEGAQVGTLVLHVSFSSLFRRLLEYALGVLAIASVALILAYRMTRGLRQRMVRVEDQLDQLAFYDAVTRLPNRRFFERELHQAVARVAREGTTTAVLFVDVDDFKKVNDSYGHEVGDRVLKMIAERLAAAVRSTDVVARLGGDEFGVVLHNVENSESVAAVARAMIAAIGAPFPTEPTPSHVGLSIGVAMLPVDGNEPATLLRCADIAMYAAKSKGKNGFQFYSAYIDACVRGDLALEAGLRDALQHGGRGLWVAYQPQLSTRTRRLFGVEALLRWRQADGRVVSPAEFIPVAEKSGLITELGDWVLSQVCRDLVLMRASGVHLPKVSVNVSPRQLLRGAGVVARFCELLKSFGEANTFFEFEVTENALMGEGAGEVLDAFRDAGFPLSIDDFGTGYSSLGYLKRFQVGALKIDQSFVRDLPEDSENAAIVSAVIQMACALNITVVAEGVETEAQAAFLDANGCHVLQGYLLGRPMPPAELVAYVQARWTTSA